MPMMRLHRSSSTKSLVVQVVPPLPNVRVTVRGRLKGFYAALSADTMPAQDEPDPHFVTHGGRLRDRFSAAVLPAWLTEDELDAHAGEFERTGLTGALNRHRNTDRDREDLAPTAAPRSSSRPCSSAAPWTPPPPGCPTPSTPSPPPSLA